MTQQLAEQYIINHNLEVDFAEQDKPVVLFALEHWAKTAPNWNESDMTGKRWWSTLSMLQKQYSKGQLT